MVEKRKPNLFIVGAPKCGTTAWVNYLSSHPSVFFSTPKEPHYFCYDFPRYRWFKNLDEYLDLFQQAGSASVIGEASVQYLYSREAAAAISDFNPDARIIILLRPQEQFLPSLHNQLVFNGDENITDFEGAWRLSGIRNHTNIPKFCREIRFLDYEAAGRFSEQVQRYYDHFPPNQIRLLQFADWTANPRDTYLEILAFLGLADDGRIDFRPVNLARRRRFNWLTPLLKRPPAAALQAYTLFQRVMGRDFRLRSRLLALNSAPTSVNPLSPKLHSEIRAHYELDNHKLVDHYKMSRARTG